MQAAGNEIIDLNSGEQTINSRLSALKASIDTLKAEKDLEKSIGNSFSKGQEQITSQLDKIKDLQKRYQREPPNSMDQLLDFLFQTRGDGLDTLKYLRKKFLEVASTMNPKVQAILKEESLKALGCSQEQTYQGTSPSLLQLQPLSTIPQGPNDGFLYIPVQSIDFFGNLKNTPESKIGKVYYEKPDPSSSPDYKPFGGRENYPMNKQLYRLMEPSNIGRSLSQILGQNYKGVSGQNLFDVQYTTTNQLGISGNFYRVALIDRENNSGITVNRVGEFISDYYSTIRIFDSVDYGAQIVNLLSQCLNIKGELGWGELDKRSRFDLIVQRILGLCFDERREIDVSGIAKVGELDGVDESFYELNEIDLRNIDIQIANIQNGVIEFKDCDNIKFPVDSDNLIDQLIELRDATGSTVDQQVATLESIIDSISENPEWKPLIPKNFNLGIALNQEFIKKLPVAIAACVLTPKVLLPIFTVMAITQSASTFTYNQIVTSANTSVSSTNQLIVSANTLQTNIAKEGSNIINSGEDFLRKWKQFSISIISRINGEFLRTLYEILKRDILNLISIILRDIQRSEKLKKYAIILRLLEITIIVARLINDYRRCKSLLNEILLLLNLINGRGTSNDIPLALLGVSDLLPGFSPQRANVNFLQLLQRVGIPTGVLPDGSPNLMALYQYLSTKAWDKEWSENSKTVTVSKVPGILSVGKSY